MFLSYTTAILYNFEKNFFVPKPPVLEFIFYSRPNFCSLS